MAKKSENKSGPPKGKGNASPYSVGGGSIKPKNPKAPATTKLNPVSGDTFYADKTRSSARVNAAKAKASVNPKDLPSPPADWQPEGSKRNVQADGNVIEVDHESEDDIEEVETVAAAPSVHNGRASMTAAGSGSRRIEKTSVVAASTQSQIWADLGTQVQAKSRDMSIKGKGVSYCVSGVQSRMITDRVSCTERDIAPAWPANNPLFRYKGVACQRT